MNRSPMNAVRLVFPLVIIIILSSCTDQSPTHQSLGLAEFHKIMEQKDLTMIDLRTPAEIADGKIAGALEIDFRDSSFATLVAELPRDKAYGIYCHGGSRSAKALNQMKDLGFREVYELSVGFSGWEE